MAFCSMINASASAIDCLARCTFDWADRSWASYSGDNTRPTTCPSVTGSPSSTVTSANRPAYLAETSTSVASIRPFVFSMPFGILWPRRRWIRFRTFGSACAVGDSNPLEKECTSLASRGRPPATNTNTSRETRRKRISMHRSYSIKGYEYDSAKCPSLIKINGVRIGIMSGIAWACSPENGTRHVGFNNTNVSLDDRPPKCRCHATYQLRRQVLKAYNER